MGLVKPFGGDRQANPDDARGAIRGGIPVIHAGKLGPVPEDLYPGLECPACRTPIVNGAFFTLIPVGPGPDPEARRAARFGAAFNVATLVVCWACASGEEPARVEPVAPDNPEPPTDPAVTG